MALAANNDGRIQARQTASGGLPPIPGLAEALLAGAGQGGPAAVAVPLKITIGRDKSREVRTEGVGWTSIAEPGTREFTTIDDAINSWYLMDDDYRESVMQKMWAFGLIDGANNETQAVKAWAAAVEQSWNYRQAGKDVAPTDMFQRMTNLKAGQQGNEPRTQTNRSYQYLDPANAQAFVRQAFQQAVGRDPHDSELRQMAQAIIDGSREDPTVTSTTVDPQGNSSTRVEEGFDPKAYIANQLNADPEAAAYQAASQLYPALIQALQSPV